MNQLYFYRAVVTRVVDGDTIDVMIDLGFNLHRKISLRLSRINTINTSETRTGDLVDKTKEYLESILKERVVFVRTEKKNGGWVAELYLQEPNTPDVVYNLNDDLLEKGLAVSAEY